MTEKHRLICGDNATVLRDFPSGSVDLTVTSPPYDDLRRYSGFFVDYPALIKQLHRVTRTGGVVVWVVGDQVVNSGGESGNSMRQALMFMDVGFLLHDTMIYKKNSAPYPERNRCIQVWEYMFVFSLGRPSVVNLPRDRRNKYLDGAWGKVSRRGVDGTLTPRKAKYSVAEYGVRFNIWEYNTGAGFSASDDLASKHPAIFPEDLARDHILMWSNPGATILDPFSGSGTVGKMSVRYDREFIGIDISQEYVDLASKRIGLEAAQGKLF